MLQRTLCNRTFLKASKLLRLGSVKTFSDVTKDNDPLINKEETSNNSLKNDSNVSSQFSAKKVIFKNVIENSQNDTTLQSASTNEHSENYTDSINISSQEDTEKSIDPLKDLTTRNLGEEGVTQLLREAASYEHAEDNDWMTTPYPREAPTTPELDMMAGRPSINPAKTSIILFPGQGTVKVGMVQKYLYFPRVKELFKMANEVLGYDLLKLCLDGPQAKLNRTHFNQPATVLCSLAALEELIDERPNVLNNCVATAGYSVGELTALIFAGVLTFEDGIKLVSVRATAMQFASEQTPQGMLSVFCSPSAKLGQVCNEAVEWSRNLGITDPVCQTAIYMHTQGKILGGNISALEYVEKHGHKFGLSKIQRLPVSGAFHTPLMEPSLKAIRKILDTIHFDAPRVPTYSNYTAAPYIFDTKKIRSNLMKQIVRSVKWEQIMHRLYKRPEGNAFPKTYDIGSNGKMRTVLKLINRKASDSCTVI